MLTATDNPKNLGLLHFGRSYNFNFVITNVGDTIITVNKIEVGCSPCTEVEPPDRSLLAPNDSMTLKITFKPGGLGLNKKYVYVNYTDGAESKSLTLEFKATIE